MALVSTSFCEVQPPPVWSRRMVTMVPPENGTVLVLVELSFAAPEVPALVNSPVEVIVPPR